MSRTTGPQLRLEFWRAFKQYMTIRGGATCGRASSETWMHHDAQVNCGRLFSMVRTRSGEIGSQFALDDHTARTVFAFLERNRTEVDAAFGAPLTWRVVSERMHEIEVRRPGDLEHRDEWPDLFAWLSDNLVSFRRALGPLLGSSAPATHHGDWDESSFFETLTARTPRAVQPARHLLDWGHSAMPHIHWGHGKHVGSFVPTLLRYGTEHTALSVWTDGLFCIRFGALKKEPPFADEALRTELLARLNDVPLIDLPSAVLDRYPSLPLPLLEDPRAMDGLVAALDWCVATVKSG